MNNNSSNYEPLPIDWNFDEIVKKRNRYYAASQRAFVPYQNPLILKRGQGQYLWDEKGNKLIDLLGMNLCISVGHAQPDVVAAVQEQVAQLTHCTTMFYHPCSCSFCRRTRGYHARRRRLGCTLHEFWGRSNRHGNDGCPHLHRQ